MLNNSAHFLPILLVLLVNPPTKADLIVDPSSVTTNATAGFGSDVSAVVDGSGLSSQLSTGDPIPSPYPSHTDTFAPNMFETASTTVSGVQFIFDLGGVFDLTGMHVWNGNENTSRGIKDLDVLFSTTSPTTGFSGLQSFALGQASGLNSYTGESVSFSSDPQARWVRFNVGSNFDNAISTVQLSEVRFTTTAVPEPSSFVMLGTLICGLAVYRRRRSKANA